MKTACGMENEHLRLAEVYNLNVLDSPREVCFENITRILQNIFQVDIVAISIIDKDRQWFKSVRGINVTQTPREVSFCAHAIMGKDLFIVNDALKDERFFDNPLVACAPHIRFYAGYPIYTKTGYGVGSLCLIDKKPREFSDTEKEILSGFGHLVEDLINDYTLKCDNRIVNDKLNLIKQDLIDEQNMILSKSNFIDYFNYIRNLKHSPLQLDNKQRYSAFYLAVIEIDRLSELHNTLDKQKYSQLQEKILDQIIKNVSGHDIIANCNSNKYILVIDNIASIRLNQIFRKIIDDIASIDIQKYSLEKKLQVNIGWAYSNVVRKIPIARLIELAGENLKQTKQENKVFIQA